MDTPQTPTQRIVAAAISSASKGNPPMAFAVDPETWAKIVDEINRAYERKKIKDETGQPKRHTDPYIFIGKTEVFSRDAGSRL